MSYVVKNAMRRQCGGDGRRDAAVRAAAAEVGHRGWAMLVAIVVFAIGVMTWAQALHAREGQPTYLDVRELIQVSSHQVMLSQRMAKAACLHMIGADDGRQSAVARQAADAFVLGLEALVDGSEAMGLAPEADPEVLALLQDVRALSPALTASVRQLAAGDLHTVAVGLIVERNGPVLAQLSEVVSKVEARRKVTAWQGLLVNTLKQAGHQRTLLQSILKDVCFITADLNAQEARVTLRAALAQFDAISAGLVTGDTEAQLVVAPTPELKQVLADVRQTWETILPALHTVAEGGEISVSDLRQIVSEVDTIEVQLEDVVDRWVARAG